MIRRISKNNDYMDIIDSCPSGVVDDIYKVDYFIAGHPETVIEKTPEKVGRHLEVVISANEVQTLTSNGILTRKAYYSSEDQTYPDGHYDLVFVDSLDVWLGEEETDPPFDPGYLTSASMKTLNGESLVGVGNIDVVSYIPSYYVTESWISSQNFATQTWVENKSYASITYVQNIISSVESGIVSDLSSYATKSWVEGQSYLTSGSITGYATESWVQSQGYLTSHQDLSSYATQSWVEAQGYITSNPDLSPYATKSWVESQSYLTSGSITGYATESWVSSNFLSTTALSGYATQSWVNLQGFITIDNVSYYLYEQSYATEDWVSSYISSVLEGDQDPVIRHDALYDTLELYASISWVEEQGYLTSHQDLTGYATQSWVQSQGYLTSHQDLSSYATQSWVESKGYLTSVPSGYATESWVTSNFFEESKIWTGTFDQWLQLTSAQQAFYTIALIIE